MNIEGLDYNTQREKLILPEYGREIQKMIDHAVSLPTKDERQRCAETIVGIMDRMFPQNRESVDYKQKLWDHLAIMSNFKLDIDYPFGVDDALVIAKKPEPLEYPMSGIPVRHYGKMIFDLFEKLKTMPEGTEREELVRVTANQMKRNLGQWGHGANDYERIADDLARFTDGVIQIDLSNFKFEKMDIRESGTAMRNRRRR